MAGDLIRPASRYIKKPIPIQAVRIDKDFQIETPEGMMNGRAGDYLVQGVRGKYYPVKKEIFEQTYDPVKSG